MTAIPSLAPATTNWIAVLGDTLFVAGCICLLVAGMRAVTGLLAQADEDRVDQDGEGGGASHYGEPSK